MASGSETDETAVDTIQRAVGPLVSALSRAVFGVCTVVVGVLTLLLAAGEHTAESSAVFGLLGVAALVVGFVTIGRLPTPHEESSATDAELDTDDRESTADDHSELTGSDTGPDRTE